MKKKQIIIKKNDIKYILILFFVPLLLLFIIEHFGDFKYSANTNGKNVPVNQIKILTINFDTPFGNRIWTDGKGFTYNDTVFEDGKFHSYGNKFPYYFKGLIADVIYSLIFSVVLIGIYFFKKKFKIKLIDENQTKT